MKFPVLLAGLLLSLSTTSLACLPLYPRTHSNCAVLCPLGCWISLHISIPHVIWPHMRIWLLVQPDCRCKWQCVVSINAFPEWLPQKHLWQKSLFERCLGSCPRKWRSWFLDLIFLSLVSLWTICRSECVTERCFISRIAWLGAALLPISILNLYSKVVVLTMTSLLNWDMGILVLISSPSLLEITLLLPFLKSIFSRCWLFSRQLFGDRSGLVPNMVPAWSSLPRPNIIKILLYDPPPWSPHWSGLWCLLACLKR